MGSLFSSPEPQRQQSTSQSRSSSYMSPAQNQNYERQQQYILQQRLEEERRRQEQARNLREQERIRQEMEERRQRKIIPVSSRPLSRAVFQQPLAYNWSPMTTHSSFTKVTVQNNTQEYNEVVRLFKTTTQKRFKVTQIERIQNPYLLGCYLLKKSEMESQQIYSVEEMRLFHGTNKSNVQSICENNFNWRMHGGSTGNRFGKGVSFSPISYYASHYSDKNATEKVMFLVRVLVSNSCIGNGNMNIPPLIDNVYNLNNTLRCDTAQKSNGHVIVKFCDNEYYPEYLIHYTVGPVTERPTRVDYDAYDYDDDY
ncbi:protein mono-ADP-ribosyltransferase PARP11-like [Periplaneta americana]|uniref:protein mono-ADP-ribosyltransferase PARP11-like n=1 Tax=Periplaneta americana TaxID=6978 RepID=UPI0037E9384B